MLTSDRTMLSGAGAAVAALVAVAALAAAGSGVSAGLAATVPPATLAVGVALALDLLAGEPPTALHPVGWFGRLVAPLDRPWSRPRAVGLLGTVALPLVAAAVVAGSVAAAAAWRPLAGVALAGVWLFVATSLRRLLVVAGEVSALVETDPDGARHRLRALAGRDASDLSAGEIRSAVVESLVENLADGLVAPLAAFAVGAAVGARLPAVGPPIPAPVGSPSPPVAALALALALGAGGAAWVKAVNTMDSMLGYHDKPVGWAPARLDDFVMWVPARASALLLALVARDPSSVRRARTRLDAVPSPNSGWPMGVAAAALGVRLEKPGVYVLGPERALPTDEDVTRARRLCAGAGLLTYLLAGVATWV